MKKTFAVVSVLAFLVLLLCTGCKDKNSQKGNTNSSQNADRDYKPTIGFSIDTLAIERWQRDLDVFMNKAKELGANVIVQNAGNNLEEQNRQLIYLMERNIDVLVVLPKEADGLTETLQKIKSRNIPIISYDRLITGTDIDLYVTIDSEKVGYLMGTGLQKYAKGTNWYCILGAEEDFNMTLICKGIDNAIKNTPYSLNHFFYADDWNYDLAYDEMVRLISNEDIPDAIVCGNDAVADSVIHALALYYKGPSVPVCGQDADIAACQNIINGKQAFTIYKPITRLAEMTAEIAFELTNKKSALEISQGKTINNNFKNVPVVWLEPTLVDKTNLDEMIINSGFHTYNEVYKN